jgi:hypothetical protein
MWGYMMRIAVPDIVSAASSLLWNVWWRTAHGKRHYKGQQAVSK